MFVSIFSLLVYGIYNNGSSIPLFRGSGSTPQVLSPTLDLSQTRHKHRYSLLNILYFITIQVGYMPYCRQNCIVFNCCFNALIVCLMAICQIYCSIYCVSSIKQTLCGQKRYTVLMRTRTVIRVLLVFSVYPCFSSNENARNSNYVSVYFV